MVKIIGIKSENEWLQFRGTGIGASEVANLFSLNPFQSKLEFFHFKVGFNPKPFYNLRLAYGSCTETLTSDLVATFDATNPESHAMNLKNGKRFREVMKLPERAFVVNDSCPHLFSSPDREVIVNGIKGYVEAKDCSSMHINMYSDKIPTSHKIQARTQMMVGEMPFNILAHIIDAGREYKEYIFQRDGIIFNDHKNNRVITEQDLKEEVEIFWQSVVLGRELSHKIMVARQQFQYDKAEQYQALLDQCEPSPDTSNAYEQYLKETAYSFAKPKIERNGTEADEIAAENFLKTKEQMKSAEEIHQRERNNILNLCKRGERIILGKNKYIEVANTKVGISIKVKN